MSHPDDDAQFDAKLAALGIDLPPEEIAHLRRTFVRQRATLRSWEGRVPLITEPALTLSLRDGSGDGTDGAAG